MTAPPSAAQGQWACAAADRTMQEPWTRHSPTRRIGYTVEVLAICPDATKFQSEKEHEVGGRCDALPLSRPAWRGVVRRERSDGGGTPASGTAWPPPS